MLDSGRFCNCLHFGAHFFIAGRFYAARNEVPDWRDRKDNDCSDTLGSGGIIMRVRFRGSKFAGLFV